MSYVYVLGDHVGVYNHEPPGYRCPFCRNINEGESDLPLEIVHRYDRVVVKMNPKWWPNNPGAVLVVPIDHYENVFDLPVEFGTPLQEAVRDTALAMKQAFACDGVSTRQHNAGYQDVWHHHVHVFPRFEGDKLYRSDSYWPDAVEITAAADRLRAAWPVV